MRFLKWTFLISLLLNFTVMEAQNRPRDYGISFGTLPIGPNNSITDVPGVKVGQVTNIKGKKVRTGITAILAHEGNIFQQKVPAAIYLGNGFGKLMGYSQVEELGNLETPIVLTNTLSVPIAANGVIRYVLGQKDNENVRSVNPLIGETNDGRLNDIRSQPITEKQVIEAIEVAQSGKVEEGNVGAGTGTICFGWKGGIGTSSRKIGDYTVGVLVQTNFGGNLKIGGADFSDLYRTYRQAQEGKEDK
ncbi:MAG: P1 family peptidase, partial [Bacteroidota bacterium]